MSSAHLSFYGSRDLRTPNIDSIALSGLLFRQAYANAPECTPSRSALLTGRYQQRVGGLECAIGLSNAGRYDEAMLQKRGKLSTLPKLNWRKAVRDGDWNFLSNLSADSGDREHRRRTPRA